MFILALLPNVQLTRHVDSLEELARGLCECHGSSAKTLNQGLRQEYQAEWQGNNRGRGREARGSWCRVNLVRH